MKSVICTLYEGHYDYGVAALANSLYKNGFRGDLCVGLRGEIPGWSTRFAESKELSWPQSRTFLISEGFKLHFLPVNTPYHLTNYKADFMVKLMEDVVGDFEYLSYFDPDIVVKCKWDYFEKWMDFGVAMVHDMMANNMPPSHPIRKEWEKVIARGDLKVLRQLNSYINGGFCGVSRSNSAFIKDWQKLMNLAIEHYGLKPDKFMPYDRTHPFFASDQDTLNVAAMCSESPISLIGPEGMDFTYGGWIMSHAVGSPKPWKKNFFKAVFNGIPPSLAEKEYWKNIDGPISIHQSSEVKLKRLSISISSLISRFYHKH